MTDLDNIQSWLEWAGKSLLLLPVKGCKPASYRSFWPDFPPDPNEAYGYNQQSLKLSPPSAEEIGKMDLVFELILLIPDERIRRIIQARSLVAPLSGKYIWSWARIGRLIHLDRRSVRRLHYQGLVYISKHSDPCKMDVLTAFFNR